MARVASVDNKIVNSQRASASALLAGHSESVGAGCRVTTGRTVLAVPAP